MPCGDVDVTSLTEIDVSHKEICAFFSPKIGKNGSKYASYTILEAVQTILSLYRRVYQMAKIPNDGILLQFVKGLLLHAMERKVDWDGFAVVQEVWWMKVKATKTMNSASALEGYICHQRGGEEEIVALLLQFPRIQCHRTSACQD